MGRKGVKTGRIYIKLYISIFSRQNFPHPPKVFLSETLYVELPKNLVICFKGTLASLLLDTAKAPHSCLFLLGSEQQSLGAAGGRPGASAVALGWASRSGGVCLGLAGCGWSGAIHVHLGAAAAIRAVFGAGSDFRVG